MKIPSYLLRPLSPHLVTLRLGSRSSLGLGLLLASTLIAGAILGGPATTFVVTSGLLAVLLLARTLSDPRDRRFVLLTVGTLYLTRQLFMLALHVVLLRRGFDGSMFSDDYGYQRIAAALAASWRGVGFPFGTDPSVINNYTRVAGALFWIVGDSTPALKALNTAFAVGASVLAYGTALLIAGRRAARWTLVALLIFPSLVLWSSLALKDAYVLFFAAGTVYALTRFAYTPRVTWLLLAGVMMLPIADTRGYLFFLLAVGWLLVFLLWGLVLPRRALPTVLGGILVSALFVALGPRPVTPDDLGQLEDRRQSMALGARSSFVERSLIVDGVPGTRFTVRVPGRTADPGRTPAVVQVPVGSTLVVGSPDPSGANQIAVQPGDVVIIITPTAPPTIAVARTSGSSQPPLATAASQPSPVPSTAPGTTSAPAAIPPATPTTPRPSPARTDVPLALAVPTQAPPLLEVPEGGTAIAADAQRTRIARSLAGLPRGILYVLAAPFPWDARSLTDAAFLLELLAWYPTVVFTFVGLYFLARRREWRATYVVLVLLGLGLVLSLVEGNVGTLVRHRAMLIPLAVIVASVGVVAGQPFLMPLAKKRWHRSDQ